MLDWIYDLPVKTLGTWMAVVFVGYCWVGGMRLRPFLRPFVRSRYSGNEDVREFSENARLLPQNAGDCLCSQPAVLDVAVVLFWNG
jgi:hypothetical protein